MATSRDRDLVTLIVRCKTCHYSLLNLTEHRCPECGTPFDPNDPTTFFTPQINVPSNERRVVVIVVIGVIWQLIVYSLITGGIYNDMYSGMGLPMRPTAAKDLVAPVAAFLMLESPYLIMTGMALWGWNRRRS